jgi:hypothetical protein
MAGKQAFLVCWPDGNSEVIRSDGVQFHPNGMVTFYDGVPGSTSARIIVNIGPSGWRWIKDHAAPAEMKAPVDPSKAQGSVLRVVPNGAA